MSMSRLQSEARRIVVCLKLPMVVCQCQMVCFDHKILTWGSISRHIQQLSLACIKFQLLSCHPWQNVCQTCWDLCRNMYLREERRQYVACSQHISEWEKKYKNLRIWHHWGSEYRGRSVDSLHVVIECLLEGSPYINKYYGVLYGVSAEGVEVLRHNLEHCERDGSGGQVVGLLDKIMCRIYSVERRENCVKAAGGKRARVFSQ